MHAWVFQNCIYLDGIWVVFSNFGLKTDINVNHQFWPESLTRYGCLRSWKRLLPNYIWVRIWLIPTSHPTTMCTMGFHPVVMLLTRDPTGFWVPDCFLGPPHRLFWWPCWSSVQEHVLDSFHFVSFLRIIKVKA